MEEFLVLFSCLPESDTTYDGARSVASDRGKGPESQLVRKMCHEFSKCSRHRSEKDSKSNMNELKANCWSMQIYAGCFQEVFFVHQTESDKQWVGGIWKKPLAAAPVWITAGSLQQQTSLWGFFHCVKQNILPIKILGFCIGSV